MQVRNLKAYLANIEMTAVQFAALVDCHPNYINAIMNGRRRPGNRLARDIFHATDGVVKFETRKSKVKKRITDQSQRDEQKQG